ncbi:MAG TPA: hypothetical protein VFA17_08970 [Thermoplasmata archaeon]|nr:hypothetical protein [Thermoplasmata archaeon]
MPPPYPAAGPGYAPGYSYGDPERQKQINRTRTGVLLLLIGSLLSWIPFVGLLGGLMTLIGAILVILGRKAFGATHARNVVWSIVLFFLAIIIVAVGAIAVMGSAFAGGSNVAPASLLIVAAIGGLWEASRASSSPSPSSNRRARCSSSRGMWRAS